MNKRKRLISTLLLCVLLVGALAACASSASDEVTVCKNGGPFDGKDVRMVVDPGQGPEAKGLFTDCFSYPVSTRIYAAGSDDGADRGPLTCTTSDAVAIRMAVSVRFTLNTESHELIEQEFNEVLNRYDAHTDEGWDRMLDATIGRELDSQVEATCRSYTGRELTSGEDSLAEVQSALAANLRNRINDNVGVTLFCGPGVPYGEDDCPELTVSVTRLIADSEATREAFESEVRAEAETRAAQQEIRTAEARAESIEALNEALAGAGENYVLLELIRACQEAPESCPALWVVPSGTGAPQLTAPGPQG